MVMSYKCGNGITRPLFLAQVRELAIESGNTELQLALLKYDAPVSRKRDTRRKTLLSESVRARGLAQAIARLSEKR